MIESLQNLINKIIPQNTPTFFRKFAKWTFIFFTFFGLLLSFKNQYPIQMISTFLMFLVIGTVCALSVPYAFQLLMFAMNKTTFLELDERFRRNGFTPDFPQTVKASNPFGAPKERLIAAYLYLMTEDYTQARKQLSAASDSVVPLRYSALERVSRIRLAAMTGNLERAEQLFSESKELLDATYTAEPDLLESFKPYLDDTLDYYMLAAVFSERLGMHEAAESYRTLVEFQSGRRETRAEAQLLVAVFELNLLYAQGRLEEADGYNRQLSGEISTASSLPQGRQDDLLKMLGQARLFSNISASSTAAIDITRERNLPDAIETSVPFSSEHGDDPDDMASIPFL